MRRASLIGGAAECFDLGRRRSPGLASSSFDGVTDSVPRHAEFEGAVDDRPLATLGDRDRGVAAPERRGAGDEAVDGGAGGDERDDVVGGHRKVVSIEDGEGESLCGPAAQVGVAPGFIELRHGEAGIGRWAWRRWRRRRLS